MRYEIIDGLIQATAEGTEDNETILAISRPTPVAIAVSPMRKHKKHRRHKHKKERVICKRVLKGRQGLGVHMAKHRREANALTLAETDIERHEPIPASE